MESREMKFDALDLGSSGQPCEFKSHLAQIISKTGESRFSFWGDFLNLGSPMNHQGRDRNGGIAAHKKVNAIVVISLDR